MNANSDDFAALSALLIEQCPDAIIFTDAQGIIQLWNAAAERLFGFAQGQARGASVDIIIPEHLREAHWQGFRRAVAQGRTRSSGKAMTTKALRADGAQIYVEFSFALIVDAQQQPIGALALARESTERFLKERADRARLRELESMLASQGLAK